MRRVSKRRAKDNRLYAKLREPYLQRNPLCRCCKWGQSQEVHHMKGRMGSLLCATEYWMPVCISCHRIIEKHKDWAMKQGYRIDRLVK